MSIKPKFIVLLFLSALSSQLSAQRTEILSPQIATVTVMANEEWQEMPVALLGRDHINIGFDELSHEYHRYRYQLEHCDADWSLSDGLFQSDYLSGFYDNNIIEDYVLSDQTYQLYTHYMLSFPNEQCSIKMSGNYRLSVFDDDEDSSEPVFRCYFMVYESSGQLSLGYTTQTDIDFNSQHQQISMQLQFGSLGVTNPQGQIRTVVLQNQRWDSAVWDAKWQYTMQNGLKWEHCKQLIFPGGNEYYRFEMLDPTHTTLGLAHVGWDKERSEWHAYVDPNGERMHYSYAKDADGAFLIRNSDNVGEDYLTDYIQTHFELHCPEQEGRVFINGNFTYDSFLPQYEMQYNSRLKQYELQLPLKQGYYSFQYLLMKSDGTLGNISTERNFAETENSYQALAYWRAVGGRADRLIGYATIQTSANP